VLQPTDCTVSDRLFKVGADVNAATEAAVTEPPLTQTWGLARALPAERAVLIVLPGAAAEELRAAIAWLGDGYYDGSDER
jgi:DNA-binding transcriptional regulator YdaS (Cro superfamily)